MRRTREPYTYLGKTSARPHKRAVALEVPQDPRRLGKCNCHRWQRAATSPFVTKSLMPKPGLRREKTHEWFLDFPWSLVTPATGRERPQRLCSERGPRHMKSCQERGPQPAAQSAVRSPREMAVSTVRGPACINRRPHGKLVPAQFVHKKK